MIPEWGTHFVSGTLKFRTIDEMRKYIKELLDSYAREYDRSSAALAVMLRNEEEFANQGVIQSRGWKKVGEIYVNFLEPGRSTVDMIFTILREMKPRIERTEQVLKSFDKVENLALPQDSNFLLFLRNGIPERIVVEPVVERRAPFEFTGLFATE